MDNTDFPLFGGKKNKFKNHKNDKVDVSGDLIQGVTFEKDIILSRPTQDEYYNCDYPNMGVALVFNHNYVKGQKNRMGTEKDRNAIQQTLIRYGFDVRIFDDLTFAELSDILKATAKEDHTCRNCLVVVTMSHGLKGKLYAKDVAYPVECLWQPFLGEKCTTLINKPKIFFIQACRGVNLEKAVTFTNITARSRLFEENVTSQTFSEPITYAIPNTADILIMYSTLENHFSFRNIENGSWFIQSLCQVLNEAADKEVATAEGVELLRMLTAVNRKVAYEYQSNTGHEAFDQMKEMPNFISTLTKIFYLQSKCSLALTPGGSGN